MLMDFVGGARDASATFLVIKPGEKQTLHSNLMGSLASHGLTTSSTICVRWLQEDDEFIHDTNISAAASDQMVG